MDVRETLIALMTTDPFKWWTPPEMADHLIDHGVTIIPVAPGPYDADPNIMELCFKNGERHMKEKMGKELTRIAEHMPCITLAQAMAILEGL